MMAGSSVEQGIDASPIEQQRDEVGSTDQLESIFKHLCDGKTKKFVLVGERGVGKTWIAKKLSERATRDDSFEFTIWIYLCREYSGNELCESIARQLSLIFAGEEWEAEKDNEKAKEEDRTDISVELKKKISKTLNTVRKFLLILDDEGSKVKETDIWPKLKELLPLDQEKYTVLITSVDNTFPERIQVKPLPEAESLSLVEKKMGRKFDDCPRIKRLGNVFVKKCKGLPAKIILLAKVLNYFEKQDSGLQSLESALEEASSDENYDFVQLLCSGDLLPRSVLVDCCWQDRHIFRECGSVHYNELITYWMLEGYLGCINSIEKAYETGHHVLMDLIDCRILKELEAGYVIMNRPELDLYDFLQPGFGATARLGLATIFESNSEGFGRITHGDGIMQALSKDNEGQFFSTLLLDGDHSEDVLISSLLSKEKLQVLALFNSTIKSLTSLLSGMKSLRVLVLRGCDIMEDIHPLTLPSLTVLEISGPSSVEILPNDFFEGMHSLRTLNLSELRIKSLPESLYHCKELRWLILRMCSNLEALGSVAELTHLMVLDLCNATSLKFIKDKHFLRKDNLHTINLSKTRIKTLPLLKDLVNLTHLFLSDCTVLDRLRGMATLKNLQVLVLSNSSKFQEFHDQSLGVLKNLKILDLSGCSLDHLPSNIGNPHYLYLRGCSRLKFLLSMEALKDLEVLDVSGSRKLTEIGDEFFKHLTCLRVLNLSETIVKSLPSLSSLQNLRELLLSHCASLEKLEGLYSLKNLEVIDLSYCSALTDIEDNSFHHMSRLLRLDLSNTKIEILPPLSNSINLRRFVLKNCTRLKLLSLPTILSQLEELNFTGVDLSGDAGADFVECMSKLRILNLSETKLKHLPSMSKLTNLSHLYLGGCQHLKEVPGLDKLTELEVLDLSGTAVSRLEFIHCLRNLRHLLLRDCSNIQDIAQLKMIDLLGPTVAELPCEISDLTHLELLDLPRSKENQGSDTTKNPLECQNQQQWIISGWSPEVLENNDKHVLSVSRTLFRDLLELEGHPKLSSTIFKQFHFLVRPIEQLDTSGIKYFYKDELVFRDIWFQTRRFAHPERSLEIRGFNSYPEGVEPVLGLTEFVYLIDNPFIKWLSDSDVNSLKEVKGCWIERCNELERVEKKDAAKSEEPVEDIANSGDNLRALWASSASNLKSTVDNGNLQGNTFNNLKFFYLDYCPKLSKIFSSLQRLENLEILEIKFCAELVTVFEDELATLPKLQTLHLWALPKLVKVGCKVPVLRWLKVGECPMLENLFSSFELPKEL